jgi:hypothetical protein
MCAHSLVVADEEFFGAPVDEADVKARTGICGIGPELEQLQRTCEQLAGEHCLYPSAFLERVGVQRYVMCEELRYNGQRRRDVPDLASGSLYIDVGDRAVRRKRHSFHHELWHMVDYHLFGKPFTIVGALNRAHADGRVRAFPRRLQATSLSRMTRSGVSTTHPDFATVTAASTCVPIHVAPSFARHPLTNS